MKVLTNNPLVRDSNLNKDIEFLEEDYIGILKICRDYIHSGYRLLSHPLYGSVKPNETPYRTIILKHDKDLDINSVMLIEEALSTATKFRGNFDTPKWPLNIIEDFQVVDFDIFKNTIERIEYVI